MESSSVKGMGWFHEYITVSINYILLTIQAKLLLELTEKQNLTQMVKDSTRNLNILDLVFTDYPTMIGNIDHIKHNVLTDHDTLIFTIDIENFEHQDDKKVNFCSTKILNYKIENMTVEKIAQAKIFLREQDWENVTAESLTDKLEEMVITFCEARSVKKVS